MITAAIFASMIFQQGTKIPDQDPTKPAPQSKDRKVVVLPWGLAAATEEAQETVRKTVRLMLEKANYEVIPEARAKRVWEEDMAQPAIKLYIDHENGLTDLPTPKNLLTLGEKLEADLVCAGRAKWHTKSVWVNLGPKTKAECTVDMILIDVKLKEVVLKVEDMKADSTRSESGLETAGAVLVSMGITSLSGGPKTPHQKRAGAVAVALAFDPWLKTMAAAKRKIGD